MVLSLRVRFERETAGVQLLVGLTTSSVISAVRGCTQFCLGSIEEEVKSLTSMPLFTISRDC